MAFSPPECVRGMKSLKAGEFSKTIRVPALRVDGKHCSLLLKKLNKCLLNVPRLKNIVPDTQQGDTRKKLVLLNSEMKFNTEQESLVKSCACEKTEYDVELGYDYWTSEQILTAILPTDISEVTTAFETIGHIAHMNLRESQLEYKNLIGQVILDKNSQIKTVVNKVNMIDETYRFFRMELLAGDDKMVTTTREHGCLFTFDFSKVYWNSRLQSEHKRLVDLFVSNDVICDMFAGVGPFAVPAAKKGCMVHANDLNPESFSSLDKNCNINHVDKNVHCYNMDAREFVRKLVKKNDINFDHVIMNLPATAVEFLDVFKGLYHSETENSQPCKLPTIHCYCFSKAEDFVQDAQKRVMEVLGVTDLPDCEIFNVRNVAPKKMMLCVSFKLPQSVAMDKKRCLSYTSMNIKDSQAGPSAGEQSTKRTKVTPS